MVVASFLSCELNRRVEGCCLPSNLKCDKVKDIQNFEKMFAVINLGGPRFDMRIKQPL